MPTPWRKLSYEILSEIQISGNVLDLGGSRRSGYHELFNGKHTFDVVNLSKEESVDLAFDIEKVFPVDNEKYDGVLAINVLEHIFDYKNLLSESFRILKKEGKIVIAVPFLMFIHPSPHDYWRYSKETLEKMMKEVGFKKVEVQAIGRGPGAVYTQLIGGVRGGKYPRIIVAPFMCFSDMVLRLVMSQEDLADRFPLGYVVTAKK